MVDISGDGQLTKKILKAGNGESPPAEGTHTMIMHYTGRLTNGTVFDSSVQVGSNNTNKPVNDTRPCTQRGTPFEFVLGSRQVRLACYMIASWGVPHMFAWRLLCVYLRTALQINLCDLVLRFAPVVRR